MKISQSIIAASVVLVAAAMVVFWVETNRPEGQSVASVAGTTGVDGIEPGNPCDSISASDATDTRGLQCYLYSSNNGQAAPGVWMNPDETVPMLFYLSDDTRQGFPALENLTVGAATQGWKTYDSPDGTFSFRYPPTWTVMQASSSDTVTVTDAVSGDFESADSFTVEYHGNNFYNTNDARFIAQLPDGIISYDASSDVSTFLPSGNHDYGHFFLADHFQIGGSSLITVEIEGSEVVAYANDGINETGNVLAYILGADPETDDYAEISYEDPHAITGLPVDLAIATLRLRK
jgi:hypothetical protein